MIYRYYISAIHLNTSSLATEIKHFNC